MIETLAMNTLRSSFLLFGSFLLYLFFFTIPSFSADADPLQDLCVANLAAIPSINGFPCKTSVSSEDFFFSGFTRPGNTSNPYGLAVTRGNVLAFPGINTLGLSINTNEFAPGGINPPHVHPRASEIAVVIEGSVLIGFITNNNNFYSKVVNPGEMFVIPRGLVHFQLNVGRGGARILSAFNSQLPGISLIPNNLFGSRPSIPNVVLTKAFRTDDRTVNILKSMFPV